MKMDANTVLITGGANGIGLALARRFAARGNSVIVCGRRQGQLDLAKNTIAGLHTLQADLAEPSERETLVGTVVKRFPALNVLVNNAGIQERPPALTEPQDWARHRRKLAINLEAPMHLSMLLMPQLAAQGRSAIVNVTSGLAFVTMAAMATYCASKAALHSFTLSLRHQLRQTSISVFEIAPPAIDSDLGGKGLHDFGVRVDEYADHAFAALERGEIESGYQFSEAGRLADRQERAKTFARMNPA